MKPSVWIGTSGWSYKHWHHSFYPSDLSSAQLLSFYMTQFPTVEINATFYRLPTPRMIGSWHDKARRGFVYAVKGSQLITHYKRLKNVESDLETFSKRVAPLAKYLGPILWQLPPQLRKDTARLRQFVAQLPKHQRHAMEFRHPSWLESDVFDLLAEYHISHVWISSNAMPMNLTSTSDFIYARFHGLQHGAAHDYTSSELKPWAQAFRAAAQKKQTVYAYFNNDWNTRAPQNAQQLMKMVASYAVSPPKPAAHESTAP